MKRIALIPAAGTGERFGAGKPKQYVDIGGRTVLQHTLDIFLDRPDIDHTVVILSPDDCFFDENGFKTAGAGRLRILRCGGTSRAETVRNGLCALLDSGTAAPGDMVLVHDAARCCLPAEALTRLIEAVGHSESGGILAVPATDTLKRAENGRIAATVPREHIWQAQTPQMFPAGLLLRALSGSLEGITDEASAVERLGIAPLLVPGDVRNLKLTLPQDEIRVRLQLSGPSLRPS